MVAEPRTTGQAGQELARLVFVVSALREHCLWTQGLTHESLTRYLLEEAHEFIEAVEGGHAAEMAGELGDILLQVVLHARLAEEAGSFTLAEVAHGLAEKMIRRSPHVFYPDGRVRESFPATLADIERNWELIKARERAAAPAARPTQSPFAGIPATLPALAAAQKTIERAARGAGQAPASPESARNTSFTTEDELGKVLFDVVHQAHMQGIDAERALRRAVQRFHAGAGTVHAPVRPNHK